MDNYFVNNAEGTKFNIQLKTLPTEGNLAWEYNPFRNYRLNEDLYEYDGFYYTLAQLIQKYDICLNIEVTAQYPEKTDNGEIDWIDFKYDPMNPEESLNIKNKTLSYSVKISNIPSEWSKQLIKWAFEPGLNWNRQSLIESISKQKDNLRWLNVPNTQTDPILREKGELVDFITDELEFDLKHPVDILPQNSYDNSVNLIINDGNTYPKLINSRFSPRGRNTYEIVDRKGNSDTNIYDRGEQFKTDTALYKVINTFPKLKLEKISNGGALKVGNYFFYFRLSDSDGNETDFFEESGLVSIFKGGSTFSSVSTGERDGNSLKQVSFQLSNLDTSYSYVSVYYSRSSSEAGFSQATEYAKIEQKFPINNNGKSNIIITGFEPITQITAEDINLTYSLLNCAETQASCQNRLFLGNVTKSKIDYANLADLSLRFLPQAACKDYDVKLTNRYQFQSGNKGYTDPVFTYHSTGYWNKELYRLGIVYIMKNGELSPVFDIRGAYNINEKTQFTNIPVYEKEQKEGKIERKYVEYDEETYKLIYSNTGDDLPLYENVKGVVRLDCQQDTDKIHHFNITTTSEVIQELKKQVKGFFFVRQHRIPTILAQGITIGIDKQGRVPTIPIHGEEKLISRLHSNLTNKTHVNVSDFNGLNYISEGFLSRYKFKFKKKSSSIWKKIGMIVGAVVAVAAIVVASVFTFGAAAGGAIPLVGAVGSAILGSTAAAGAAAALGSAIIIGGAAAAGGLVGTMIGGFSEMGLAIQRVGKKVEYNGRKTEVPNGYKVEELSDSRTLTNNFEDRLIIKGPESNEVSALLCPEYSINQSFFNSIFCGNEHLLESTITQAILQNRDAEDLTSYSYRSFSNQGRQFYISEYKDYPDIKNTKSKVVPLTDNQKVVAIDDNLYRGRAGEAEEAWRCIPVSNDHLKNKGDEWASENNEGKKINSDYVRGSFGPYLAIEASHDFTPAETVNIYMPGYDPANYEEYVKVRMQDSSAYKAITHRIDINDLNEYLPNQIVLANDDDGNYEFPVFRGDCYLCKFTHRLIRNFCDPAAPYNDEIIDKDCWKEGYDPTDASKYDKINLGDVNAVQLGMWVTFNVRASRNLNVLTLDESNVDELTMSGHARGHYPQIPMSVEGSYKIPDSQVYNAGFETSLSERYNYSVSDVPYIKQWFGTRIMYSDIQVTDSFKNGFRQFWSTNYRDYPIDYGSITKIINWKGALMCVFEHGIAIIPVNERAVAGQGSGGTVYINTSNVLPENPNVLSDKYGSQWKDSVIATPNYVYGVDTIAKKIWRTNGSKIELISDLSVQEFLNQHISLSERELEPILGIRNVKTHYNAFKQDVMFTFYDNLYDFEEEVWNLCYSEALGKWVTFYSWVPSYSENIYNQYFSFNRDTSKYIAKLGISNADSNFADGVVLSKNVIDSKSHTIPVIKDNDEIIYNEVTYIGELHLVNRNIPSGDGITSTTTFEIIRDVWGNYKNFVIGYIITDKSNRQEYFTEKLPEGVSNLPQVLCYIGDTKELKAELYQQKYVYTDTDGKEYIGILDKIDDSPIKWLSENVPEKIKGYTQKYVYENKYYSVYKDNTGVRNELDNPINRDNIVLFLNIRANIHSKVESAEKSLAEAQVSGFNNLIDIDSGYFQSTIAITHEHNLQFLTTDFWRHGQAGIYDIKDPIKPTHWYGQQHPFEFEFVVKDNPQLHKIFDNLEIISNNAEPESFHYEITGDCYDFAEFKKNMYIRQEATKELYQFNGSNITFNHKYQKMEEKYPEILEDNLYEKQAILPLYYARQDYIDQIKDDYHPNIVYNKWKDNASPSRDFDALAGGEIVYYDTLGEYRIWNHTKAVSPKDNSSLRSNMRYKEDKWNVQINPINIVYNNESPEEWEPLEGTQKLIPAELNVLEPPKDLYVNGNLNRLNLPKKWKRNVVQWDDLESSNKEVKVKDKYVKIRIRYKGDKLAIILAINTLYTISYS